MALCGFVPADRPSDDAYYDTRNDSMGWYMVNNMLDREATTFGGFGATVAATTETPDKAGLQLTVSSEFKTVFRNFRFGDERLENTAGLMFYIKALQDISKLRFNIGITDEANLEAIEIYSFDSYEGDYFYSPHGTQLYKVSRSEISLPAGFEGFVYFPFETFLPDVGSVPDNLYVDPDFISKISIGAEAVDPEFESTVLVLDNIMFYSSQDLLETMVGYPKDAREYRLSASGEGSEYVVLHDQIIRVYDSTMTYEKLLGLLSLDNDNLSVELLDSAENQFNL